MQNITKEKSLKLILSKHSVYHATVKEREIVLNHSLECFAHLKRGIRVSNIFYYAKRKSKTIT